MSGFLKGTSKKLNTTMGFFFTHGRSVLFQNVSDLQNKVFTRR